MNTITTRPEPGTPCLSEAEHAILAFETRWWRYAGAKETAGREQFDMSMIRYYQVLNALLDDARALVADPVTVRRLRRLRDGRRRQRTTTDWPPQAGH
jgi:hypothetical protein